MIRRLIAFLREQRDRREYFAERVYVSQQGVERYLGYPDPDTEPDPYDSPDLRIAEYRLVRWQKIYRGGDSA